MLFKDLLLVGIGGAAGSIVRYATQKWITMLYPHAFPAGTFFVNIAGCFLIGLLFGLSAKHEYLSPAFRLLLMTGFCGGFTTFSSFAYENISLLRNGQLMYFMLYAAGSLILGILATWVGMMLLKA